MKKTLLSSVAVVLLFAASEAAAQEMRPMVVAGMRSWDQLIKDFELIGEASDTPGLGEGIEQLLNQFTQGQGIPGLDRDKPWGAMIGSDGAGIQILFFMPVSDLPALVDLLAPLAGGEIEEEKPGIYVFNLPVPILTMSSIYLTQKGDWTYGSMAPEFLENLPDDPTKLLDGMNTQYHGFVRISFKDIPELFRQLAIEFIRQGIQQGLSGQMPSLPGIPGTAGAARRPPAADDLPSRIVNEQAGLLAKNLQDADQVTFGLTLDAEKKHGVIEIVSSMAEGSPGGETVARITERTSRFAGFLTADATLGANLVMPLGKREIESTCDSVDHVEAAMNKQVDSIVQLDEGSKDYLRGFVSEAFGIVKESIESGEVDLGFSVTGKGPFTLIAGARVKDGAEAEALIKKMVSAAEDQLGYYGIEEEELADYGVKLYTAYVPLPEGEAFDQLAGLFGGNLELALGSGEKAFYLGLGDGSIEGVKKAIAASETKQDETVPPLRAVAALGGLIKLASAAAARSGNDTDDNADPAAALLDLDLEELAEQLEEGNDRLEVVIKPSPGGTVTRIEMEEGLLRLVTMVMTTFTSAGLPGLPQF